MQHDDFVAVLKRLLTHAANGTTDMFDDIYRVPVETYLSPELWQQEVDQVFKKVPLLIGLSGDLPNPGNYKSMELVGTPIVVMRGTDGKARAFLNVCRHRGAEVVAPGCGDARRLVCPYHAWSYDTKGALVGVYGKESFGDIDTDELGLTELGCDEAAGMIFACLTPGIPVDARAWLGDLLPVVEPFGMQKWVAISKRELLAANWKVCFDGYLEGYHFQQLHRNTIFTRTMSNTMTYDQYGPHQRIGFAKHGIQDQLLPIPEAEWDPYPAMSLVISIFPNISLAINADGVGMAQLNPGPTSSESRTIQTVYRMTPIADADDDARAQARADFLYEVVRDEDYWVGAGVQRGMATGANTEFLFGRNEIGLQHFHKTLHSYVEQPVSASVSHG
jgi:phenylpropionate dioxygenase-like ring-hydroxylating dioxygenase large terminal subunit